MDTFERYGPVKLLKIEKEFSEDKTSIVINAYLECTSQEMMESILEDDLVVKKSKIKVSKYRTKEELQDYVIKSRQCRIYIKKMPMHLDEKYLVELFS
jgi:replicative DNA helicase